MVLTKTEIERKMDPATFIHNADKILIDNPARGVLSRIIWKIPETKPVFVAHQKDLLDHPQDWMDKLSVQSVYISYFASGYYSNSREKHDKIINILSEKYQTNLISVGIIGRNYTLF